MIVLKHPDRRGNRVCDQTELRFALAQCFFHLHTLGDVLSGGQGAGLSVDVDNLDRIERVYDPPRLCAQTHRTPGYFAAMQRIGHDAREVRTIGPQPNFQDRFSDDFVAAESALSLEARIHVEEPAVAQGTDGHGVRARAESSLEFLLRNAERLLSAEPLGDIVSHAANHR